MGKGVRQFSASEGGLWSNDTLSYTYHASAPGLRAGLSLQQPAGTWSQTYGYDAARRLQTITSPAGSFAYTYKGPGTVWTNLALPDTAAITNCFDTAARLTGTWLKNNAGVILNKHVYLYNGYGQPQRQTLTDSSYTTYGYDNDAQLLSSLGYTSGGSPVANEQLGFTYDAGWNMTQRSVNGTPTPYTVNDLNEVTSDSVNTMVYDNNGNRCESGSVTYTYDDENRLVSIISGTAYRSEFVYDGLGRMRTRTEYTWSGSSWVAGATVQYIYDGMRVIQERSAGTPSVAYTRGKDLSGSLERAGGIGGLLARSHGYSAGNWTVHNFYHADRVGNVTYLVDGAQLMAASYKYDSYGRTLSSSGSLAAANVYRFSSKEMHGGSGMYSCGLRVFDPTTQRWLNRDPVQERAGLNVYAYALNSPTMLVDPLGLCQSCAGGGVHSGDPSDPTSWFTTQDFAIWCGAGPAYGNWKPAQYTPRKRDPKLKKAEDWLHKRYPRLAPNYVIWSDNFLPSLGKALGLGGFDGYGVPYSALWGGTVFVAPQSDVDDYIDTLAHEGLHTEYGPAWGHSHDLMEQIADSIKREYWLDPLGTNLPPHTWP